ncbi:hypothetical protein EUGRSUZ_J01334 [Eucalyptus grandis]|uniref:RNA polymerase II subunit A C-terminal domain phosphatase SSU72 n=3 Tax=Eucalyptus grandis TaxID=71139 RepID=A0A059ADG8_EUCGR|nr:hypothetical protein EUGRSUZ_J01328 [Eucalyptus grandis]KAK3419298.1 hypothetical protein EUGRSUZ_J01334 [Eucalyptus grandis]
MYGINTTSWPWNVDKTSNAFCADLNNRERILMKTVLLINLEVKDNHEEAATGAQRALDLCREKLLIVSNFQRQNRRKFLFSISFY